MENQPGAWIEKDGKVTPDLSDEAMAGRQAPAQKKPTEDHSDAEK